MKKRIFAFLLSFVLIFNIMPVSAFAVAGIDGSVSISSNTTKLKVGETVVLTFTVNAPVNPVGGINFNVALPEGLEYVSHEILVEMQDFMMSSYDPETGFFGCGVSLNGKTGSFDVLKVTAKAKDSAVGYQQVNVILGDMFDVIGETKLDYGTVDSLDINVYELITELDISLPAGIDSVPVPETGKSPIVEDWVELGCDDERINYAEYQVLTDINTIVGEFFEPGRTYIERVRVVTDDGYVIDQNTKLPAVFNGFELDAGESSGNTYVFSRKTTLDTVVIDKIIITGTIDSPKAFETIKDANLSSGSGIDISYVIEHGANIVSFPTDEKYAVGDTYHQTVTVTLKNGYEFKDGFSINDIEAPMLDGFTKTYDEEYKNIIFEKTTVIDRV
ncbi:MAG: hypothetical protein IKJ57_03655, partial [Oscillospiraceae bacterium]|nr:hypothetical protein [Oscillospiraceae bacterium]